MKHMESIFKMIIVLFCMVVFSNDSIALSNPIPGIGIVAKCNTPPCSGRIVTPDSSGLFSIQLDEVEIELTIPLNQLQSIINGIVKKNFPKSTYQFDYSGVELKIDNNKIQIQGKSIKEHTCQINKASQSIIITVPKGGVLLCGSLSWNDAVMKSKPTKSSTDVGVKTK
jgi:hypothetical protein